MNGVRTWSVALVSITAALAIGLSTAPAPAAPSAEIAKRCIHYSYIVYPFKRPGAAPMSGDRQAYFEDCIVKNGDVPAPSPPTKQYPGNAVAY